MESVQKKENMIAGTVGAFLGSLLGVACIVLLGQLGYVAVLSGLVMGVCTLKGYELLGGTLSKKGAVISSLLILLMTFFAHRLDWAISVAQVYEAGIPDAFRSIDYLIEGGAIEAGTYWGNLAMLYLFVLVGAVPTIVSGLRASQPLIPIGQAGISAAGADPVRGLAGNSLESTAKKLKIYPAAKGWTGWLRVSVLFPLLFPLAIMFVMLAVSIQSDDIMCWVFASIGALAAMFIGIFLALPLSQLLRSNTTLMVRGADGTLWKVVLEVLNRVPNCHFTSKMGMWSPLTWDKFTPEEQERAELAIAHAIDTISLGGTTKGSLLNEAVTPFTDMALVKEDAWQWKITYSVRSGMRKASIAKVYPELSLSPDAGLAGGPLPFQWKTCIISLLCTAVLVAAGWGFGMLSDNDGAGDSAAHTPAVSTPRDVETYTTDEVTYQLDRAYQSSADEPDTYTDEANGMALSVAVVRNVADTDTLNYLTELSDEYRAEDGFQDLWFDEVDDAQDPVLVPLTADNGESYQYNIMTVDFGDGDVYRLGMALTDDGTLVMVDAYHLYQGDEDDETAVRSAMLGVLKSAVPTQSTVSATSEI